MSKLFAYDNPLPLTDDAGWFPDPEHYALEEPNGLLAFGGDLKPERLLAAYQRGIFPWFDDDRLPLWWCPDPRAVLFLDDFHISRSLSRKLRKSEFEVRMDTAFNEVIYACSARRNNDVNSGTWITPAMLAAYIRLHELGYAHSVETWIDGRLAGGLYGISYGAAFFGESMFSRETDASKLALHALVQLGHRRGWHFIDCQVSNAHLTSLGACEISRLDFLTRLQSSNLEPSFIGDWSEARGITDAQKA